MYDKEYWQRVNITQICEFLRTGGQTLRSDIGTPEERYLRYSKAFITGMKLYKDRVLAFDWNNTSNDKIDIILEDMYEEVVDATGLLHELDFEVGLITGIKLGQLLNGI